MDIPETYICIVLSTSHLTKKDLARLNEMVDDHENWMVMGRPPGFFIKLYEDLSHNLYPDMSDTFYQAVKGAYRMGARMIEYDCDAQCIDSLVNEVEEEEKQND